MSPNLSRPAANTLMHAIVVLWGCTAILGRQISISTVPLVWYRLLFVVIVLAAYVPLRGHSLRVPWRAARRYAGVGTIIAIHWLCFYGTIKIANVATAVLSLSTIAFFTAVLEPIVFRRRVAVSELVIGAIVVGGVALLSQVELHATPFALGLGLTSSLFSAWFGVLNGRLAVERAEPAERLMLYELGAATIVVSACFVVVPSLFVAPWQLSGADIGWLAVLAVMCTVVPQVLIISVLRTLPPFTIAVAVNLEVVYALILAALLYPDDRRLTPRFYVGAAVLLALVIVNSVRKSLPSAASAARAAATPPA